MLNAVNTLGATSLFNSPAAAVAGTAAVQSGPLGNAELQAAINNLLRHAGSGATIIVIPASSPNDGSYGATGTGGPAAYTSPVPVLRAMPVSAGAVTGYIGPVSASAAAEHRQALEGLQQNYGYFPKDANGYITKQSLEQVANDPNAPPAARRAAIYLLDPAHQKELNALGTSRQTYQGDVTSQDGEFGYEYFAGEQTQPDLPQYPGVLQFPPLGMPSGFEQARYNPQPDIEIDPAALQRELQQMRDSSKPQPDMQTNVTTLAASALFTDPKAEVSWSVLQSVADGSQSAYPMGSPQQLAAKALMDSPGAKTRLCGAGDTFKKDDLLKLSTGYTPDPKTGAMSDADKASYNAKQADDPSFFFKDGSHTPAWDAAVKAAAGDPARLSSLTAAMDPTSTAAVEKAANVLAGSNALFDGDDKASYDELLRISQGQPRASGRPAPTPEETAAAKCLIDNYNANGGKGGGSRLDQILGGDSKFDTNEMKNNGATAVAQIPMTTGLPTPTAAETKIGNDAQTLANCLLFTSELGKVQWSTLEAMANGSNPAYPKGSPEQLAAKEILDTPGAKAKLCGDGEDFTKGDMMKLVPRALTADPATGGMSAADKDAINQKPVDDPSFFYKDGSHTAEWDLAMKASEGDPARQAQLVAAMDATSPAGVKQAMSVLQNSNALWKGDDKASTAELRNVAQGLPPGKGAPVPTAEEIAAAQCLLNNYDATGGKGGKSKLDLVLNGDDKFSMKEFNNQI